MGTLTRMKFPSNLLLKEIVSRERAYANPKLNLIYKLMKEINTKQRLELGLRLLTKEH